MKNTSTDSQKFSLLRFSQSIKNLCRNVIYVCAFLLASGWAQAAVTSGSITTGTTSAPTGTAAFNNLPPNIMPTADACTANNATTYTPGNDPCATDLIIRNNDFVTYQLSYVTNSGDTITFSSMLPLVAGIPAADWTTLPLQCTGSGSGISADKQTLTCVISIASSGTQSVLPVAQVRGGMANGTNIPMPTTTLTALGGGNINVNADVASTAGSLKVSAAPLYDIVKAEDANGAASVISALGVDGVTPGYVMIFPMGVRAPYGVRGLEALSAAGLSVTDAVSGITVTGGTAANNATVAAAIQSSARVYSSTFGAPNTAGNWVGAPVFVDDGCFANNSAGTNFRRGDLPAGSGTCSVSQSAAGGPITATLTTTNWTPSSTPTFSIVAGALIVTEAVFVQRFASVTVTVYVPTNKPKADAAVVPFDHT